MARLQALPQRGVEMRPRVAGAAQTERDRTHHRDATQTWRAWYKTARWQKLRRKVLARDGMTCRATGVLLSGKYPAPNSPVVDHIQPHRGDAALFWDEDNLQSVSKEWHDRDKQSIEKGGARRRS